MRPVYDNFFGRTVIGLIQLVGLLGIMLALSACGEEATLTVSAGQGENPQLPKPNATMIPTVKIAEIKG
jgi:hypothetical protein